MKGIGGLAATQLADECPGEQCLVGLPRRDSLAALVGALPSELRRLGQGYLAMVS
jgi:hypothetical protein